nr:hybrid signal transduction histidine kinase M [Tanacetum cinerariifolium]
MTPHQSKEAWDLIADIFNDNKCTRSIVLKAELRSLKLGELSIDAYFCNIKCIATILTSLWSYISNYDVVYVALEGLPDKYDSVFDINVHQDSFLDLKIVHSMHTTKEMQLKLRAQATSIDSTSSSPMVFASQIWPSLLLALPVHLVSHSHYLAQTDLVLNSSVGQSGSNLVGHETLLPNTFSAMTLQDTNPGFHDPMGVLYCDSNGDLYTVMKSSTIPHAFLTNVVFDGAFRGVGDEKVVVGEGVVVTSSSLEMFTNNCLGGIMVSLIVLEGLEEEALVDFIVELFEEDDKRNEKYGLFNYKA